MKKTASDMNTKQQDETAATFGLSFLPPKKCQGGWAMMETLVAVIIGLLLIIGVFVYYQMATTGTNISEMRQNVMVSKANVERLFRGQSTYDGLDNALAVRAKLVPSSMVVGDPSTSEDIRTPFGGAVTFAPAAGTGAADSHFSIELEAVPQEACIELATYSRTDWVFVEVGGTEVAFDSVGEASAACTELNNNVVTFVSR